jgi:hypothetical protein
MDLNWTDLTMISATILMEMTQIMKQKRIDKYNHHFNPIIFLEGRIRLMIGDRNRKGQAPSQRRIHSRINC